MYRKNMNEMKRHRMGAPYMSPVVQSIIQNAEESLDEPGLSQSIYFGPTALTHIKRLLDTGGSIITDTMLVASNIDPALLGHNGAQVMCFIDEPQVVALAAQRGVTRAEIAVDYGLAVPGMKLLVVGSAPAAINRVLQRRQREPMSDVCVLAAPTGFANVVQLKERLMDSDMASIIVRGKKGGIPIANGILNAILQEIDRENKV